MPLAGEFKIECISVPSVSLRRGGPAQSGAQFSVFALVVEAISGGSPLRWTVHRRYTDFESLNNKLSKSYNDLPALPGKRVVGNFSSAFLDERRLQLQDYLRNLLNEPRLVTSAGFMNFIGAVQFIDQVKESGAMTSFPYTFRSGRYAPRPANSKSEDEPCRAAKCTVC